MFFAEVKTLQGKAREHKSAIAWAMQWLTYAMFHHGPVRDSLAWDVIKVTIVNARELPVRAPQRCVSNDGTNFIRLFRSFLGFATSTRCSSPVS